MKTFRFIHKNSLHLRGHFTLDGPVRKLVTLLALSATAAFAADVAYTPPVGGMQVSFDQGSRFTGITLVNPAVYRGVVASVSGTTITLSTGAANVGAALTTGTAYYLELTAGPTSTYIGDRFDLDVAATQASANGSVTVSLAQRNTLASVPDTAALAGYSITIRPHVTLGQMLGTKDNPLVQGSNILANADQVRFINPVSQAWDTYYFFRSVNGATVQWTKVGGGNTSRDSEIIPPGTGFVFVRNGASSLPITWVGEVRTNSFAQPLVAGKNLVCQPWPVSASPLQRSMTFASGLAASNIVASADKIQTNPAGIYNTYYLFRSVNGLTEQWTLIGGGNTNRGNELLFGSDTSVIISKVNADPNYIVPFIY